ncbi:hypothetical protein KR222_002931 [Zaprionus bogoriensis]|nr:hypothetical protein KR222_002931 [Zaprionus bogoriensis]
MGVKELWSVLTPHAERKPICELRGKKVAIDLAGWVCESLNVVDYFVHPRHHLKNLFFRTCYLIWEQVTPVFVLEGAAPKLKSQVIAKRNELQFRGVRPKDKVIPALKQASAKIHNGRTRFHHVLKQCENLLLSMGIQCIQGPGEAEAYCAFLNKHGLVDGVISQDSDCFAYGALRVYRNFSVSMQGAQAAAGGAVDIYDMREIRDRMDFGQKKVIVMALLCGCDYCPDGVGGIGKDGVLKLFKMYRESEILEKLRDWRYETEKYSSLELRVDDKNICTNCGHIGRTQSHSKNGCSVCRTHRGCNAELWKEKRLSIKAELALRKKALEHQNFPNEEIISEFLSEPSLVPQLNLNWQQPNLVKFIKQIGHLLQWPEIYCFQKFFPILTRWQVLHANFKIVQIQEIIKKRIVRGVPSLEIRWNDSSGCFNGLIPHEQIAQFEQDHPKGLDELYYTIEPLDILHSACPDKVDSFLKSKEKDTNKGIKIKKTNLKVHSIDGNTNFPAIAKSKVTHVKKNADTIQNNNQKTIEQFLRKKENTPKRESTRKLQYQSSTPINKCMPSDLESDCEFDMSDIINGIVSNPDSLPVVNNYEGHLLHYNVLDDDLSMRLTQLNLCDNMTDELHQQFVDPDLLLKKHHKPSIKLPNVQESRRYSLDDSFDLLVKGDLNKVAHLEKTPVQRFKVQHQMSTTNRSSNLPTSKADVSHFFNQSVKGVDVFEQLMESSISSSHDLIVISDSE